MAGGMEEVDLSTLKVNSRCHIKPQISKMQAFVIFLYPSVSPLDAHVMLCIVLRDLGTILKCVVIEPCSCITTL